MERKKKTVDFLCYDTSTNVSCFSLPCFAFFFCIIYSFFEHHEWTTRSDTPKIPLEDGDSIATHSRAITRLDWTGSSLESLSSKSTLQEIICCLLQLGGAVHSSTEKSSSHEKYEDFTGGGENSSAHPRENLLPEREALNILHPLLCLCLLLNLLQKFSKVNLLQVDACLCV